MENILLWALNVLIGVLVAFGGIILHNIRDDIKETVGSLKELECSVERQKEKLGSVIIPNVGVAMCTKIQEGQRSVLEHLTATSTRADISSQKNREDLIRFEGKIDLILARIDELAQGNQ